MAAMSVEELYEKYIKPLPTPERLKLIAMTSEDLALQSEAPEATLKRNIMDLHGLGAEIWAGRDAQDYVNDLRDEWDIHLAS
jgi:hypothetical protein